MEKVKVDKNMKFNMLITEVEKINPLFSKCKVYIMYSDLNRNNSYMSKESIEEAIPTLFNIPIIGEYLEDKDNFGGHGGRLEIADDEVKYIQTTVPYGLVPESANVYWEEVIEKDGSVNEYLVADGCILWTGRYDQLNTVMEEGKFNQSMEIIVDSGNFAVVDGKEVFKIEKFIFSALCILGVDKGNNPDDHVEPAFESSSIITYSLDKDKFKLQFNQMLEELKYTMQKGGNQVTENTNEQVEKEIKEEFESTEVIETQETIPTTDEAQVAEEFETITEVTETTEVKTEVKTITVEEDMEDGMPDNENQFEEVATSTTEATEEIIKVDEVFEEEVIVEAKDESEDLSLAMQLESANNAFAELNQEFESLKLEVEELRKFKRDSEVNELYSKFEGKLTKSELDNVFANNADKSVSEIENLIFVEIGKKNFSLLQQEKQVKQPEIQFSKNSNEASGGLYSDLIAKHLNN